MKKYLEKNIKNISYSCSYGYAEKLPLDTIFSWLWMGSFPFACVFSLEAVERGRKAKERRERARRTEFLLLGFGSLSSCERSPHG